MSKKKFLEIACAVGLKWSAIGEQNIAHANAKNLLAKKAELRFTARVCDSKAKPSKAKLLFVLCRSVTKSL
jgi:hypothetical protein